MIADSIIFRKIFQYNLYCLAYPMKESIMLQSFCY